MHLLMCPHLRVKLDTEQLLSPPARQQPGGDDRGGEAVPESSQPYGEAKEHRQGVTPANPSDSSAPVGRGASSAEAIGEGLRW